MASTKIFKMAVSIIFLSVIQNSIQVNRIDYSKLLSLLSQKVSDRKPMIVIVSRNADKYEPPFKHLSHFTKESSDEDAGSLPHLLLDHNKAFKKHPQIKKGTTKSLAALGRDRHSYRAQLGLLNKGILNKEDKKVLRSPIVQKLLGISNSLQCDAQDECVNKCNNKFKGNKQGKKIMICQVQCEEKYDCEEKEEEDYKDPCASSEDDCGESEEKSMSTRGERLVDVTPQCKRC